jgi:hypothetical protein
MPPIYLEGELVVNEGSSKKIFDSPLPANRTKSTIEVTFEDNSMGPSSNKVIFTFWLSELPEKKCTEVDPCEIVLGKGSSKAEWKVGSGSGGYLNGELTGTVYITENKDDPMNNILEFYSEELVFHPFD